MGWGVAIEAAWNQATQYGKDFAQWVMDGGEDAVQRAHEASVRAKEAAAEAGKQAKQAAVEAGQQATEQTKKTAAEVAAKVQDSYEKSLIHHERNGYSFKTDAPPDSPIQPCLLAKNGPDSSGYQGPPRQSTPPCCVQSLIVECSHSARNFKLIPPKTKTNKAWEQVIQVIADNRDAEDISLTFQAGPCNRGRGPQLPCIEFDGLSVNRSVKKHVMGPPPPAFSADPRDTFANFGIFFEYFIGKDFATSAVTYPGTVRCCEGGPDLGFRVEVFPYKKWSGTLSIEGDFTTEPVRTEFTDLRNTGDREGIPGVATLYTVDKFGTLKGSGEITATYGSKSFTVSSPTYEFGADATPGEAGSGIVKKTSDKAFSVAQTFFEKQLPRLNAFLSSEFVKIKPLWPKLTLGGGAETTEVKGQYDVAWKGEINFKAEPLFGLSGTFECMEFLIAAACMYIQPPPLGYKVSKQINEIKRKAEEGGGNQAIGGKFTCRVDFTASGQIGWNFFWKFLPVEPNKCGGTAKLDLDFILKGEISGELRILVVSYAAGVTASAETGFSGELSAFYDDKPGFSGEIKFKGLKIKAAWFQKVGGSKTGNKKTGQAAINDREKQKDGKWDPTTISASNKSDWEMVVFEETTIIPRETAEDKSLSQNC